MENQRTRLLLETANMRAPCGYPDGSHADEQSPQDEEEREQGEAEPNIDDLHELLAPTQREPIHRALPKPSLSGTLMQTGTATAREVRPQGRRREGELAGCGRASGWQRLTALPEP
jgi:hypothetical protein